MVATQGTKENTTTRFYTVLSRSSARTTLTNSTSVHIYINTTYFYPYRNYCSNHITMVDMKQLAKQRAEKKATTDKLKADKSNVTRIRQLIRRRKKWLPSLKQPKQHKSLRKQQWQPKWKFNVLSLILP